MPTMPRVMGLELQAAEFALTQAGVLNQPALNYFGAWPITAQWVSVVDFVRRGITADSTFWTADDTIITADGSITISPIADLLRPGLVVGQSLDAGTVVGINAALILQVIQYPVAVSYP